MGKGVVVFLFKWLLFRKIIQFFGSGGIFFYWFLCQTCIYLENIFYQRWRVRLSSFFFIILKMHGDRWNYDILLLFKFTVVFVNWNCRLSSWSMMRNLFLLTYAFLVLLLRRSLFSSFLSFGVHVCVYMFMMYPCPCSMHAALFFFWSAKIYYIYNWKYQGY